MSPPLLAAIRRQSVDRTPVWFMRQAGRYLPEYRKIRERLTLLDICARPDVAAEVTLQPIARLDVDAAIVFADILLPLRAAGADLEFAAGEGPVIHNPIRTPADIDMLRPVDVHEGLGTVMETIRLVRRELSQDKTVIGFAGAPFTLASYLIEGGSSRRFERTKTMMFTEPEAFDRLLARLTDLTVDYLVAQAAAGAEIVQLFDSWVGCLGPADYTERVWPHSHAVFQQLQERGVPSIHFGVGTAGLLEHIASAGGDVVGVDWTVRLDDAWARVGHHRAVQGNLDPTVLLGPADLVRQRVGAILDHAAGRPGHIFNLGHGVLPSTPVDQLRQIVDLVRNHQPTDRPTD